MMPAIAIHGGAGNLTRENLTPDRERACMAGLRAALDAGYVILTQGGTALDAVQAAVEVLENDPHFNAGRGSVYNAEGRHEMDACIMDGRERSIGAVAGISGIRNPIRAARAVMDSSPHVLLIGQGAVDFAKRNNVELADESYFHDPLRLEQWRRVAGSTGTVLDHSGPGDRKFGTVGAVACDRHGNLAAATSTGGMTNKAIGRVGDSPIVGAGTYADNATCAISCTGHGEAFIRSMVAHDIACLMEYRGLSLEEACRIVVHEKLPRIGGEGGLIAISRDGIPALPFNTGGMFRGSRVGEGSAVVAVW